MGHKYYATYTFLYLSVKTGSFVSYRHIVKAGFLFNLVRRKKERTDGGKLFWPFSEAYWANEAIIFLGPLLLSLVGKAQEKSAKRTQREMGKIFLKAKKAAFLLRPIIVSFSKN